MSWYNWHSKDKKNIQVGFNVLRIFSALSAWWKNRNKENK